MLTVRLAPRFRFAATSFSSSTRTKCSLMRSVESSVPPSGCSGLTCTSYGLASRASQADHSSSFPRSSTLVRHTLSLLCNTTTTLPSAAPPLIACLATDSDVSRISDISISSYLRTTPIVPGANRNDMGNDLFLGGVKYVVSPWPCSWPSSSADLTSAISFRFTPAFDQNANSDQWFPTSGGSGEFHVQVSFKPAAVSRASAAKFGDGADALDSAERGYVDR